MGEIFVGGIFWVEFSWVEFSWVELSDHEFFMGGSSNDLQLFEKVQVIPIRHGSYCRVTQA